MEGLATGDALSTHRRHLRMTLARSSQIDAAVVVMVCVLHRVAVVRFSFTLSIRWHRLYGVLRALALSAD